MELYSRPVPSLTDMFDFEQTRSTDAERAIGLCVADALDTLYGWLEIDNGRGGFENHTTTLCFLLGINPNRFLEYNAGEAYVANIDRDGLHRIFESGDGVTNQFGVVDYTLRDCIRGMINAMSVDVYICNYLAIEKIEGDLIKETESQYIDLDIIDDLVLLYVQMAVSGYTDQQELAYHLATLYTAGVAYTALLPGMREE